MSKDLAVWLEDRPGTLADMSETLVKANVNVEGLFAVHVFGRTLGTHPRGGSSRGEGAQRPPTDEIESRW